MKKLLVVEKNNRNYILEDGEKKQYNLRMTFFDLEKEISVGDHISMHKELLDRNYKEYSNEYYFGALDEVYGREIKSKEDIDFVVLECDNKKIYLKRFYG